MKLPRLQLTWSDNNDQVARNRLHLPEGTGVADCVAFANLLRGPALALSSAAIVGGKLWLDLPVPPQLVAAVGADSRLHLTLFYSNETASGSIVIPAPADLPYDTTGPYAGRRLTREAVIAAGLLPTIEGLVAGTVFQNNEPFPSTFTVGTLEQL